MESWWVLRWYCWIITRYSKNERTPVSIWIPEIITQKKKITWSRIITLGIIPEYQKRGLDTVFYYEIVKRAAEQGFLLVRQAGYLKIMK
jgi:hypothetical protein